MAVNRSRYPVKTKTGPARTGKLGVKLVVSLLLCACAAACRFWYPDAADAVSHVVFGRQDGAVRQVFLAFTQSLEESGAAEAFADLYGELTERAAG